MSRTDMTDRLKL